MTPTAAAQPEAAPSPLGYAPPPRWHRRRRFGLALLVTLLLCLALAGWRWGPGGWKHAQFLYWQRQCLAYAPPADHVVYENDPSRAAALLQRPGYVNVSPASAPPVAVHTPRCWSEAMGLGGVPVVNTGFGPGGPGATLFLHERTTPSGVRRLVAIHAPAAALAVAALPIPAPVIVQPATLTAGPAVRNAVARVEFNLVLQSPSAGGFSLLSTPAGTTTRFFAGRPDPADPSRFTIPFETGDTRGEIQGRLEDGDTLRLAFTSGPVASATMPSRRPGGYGTIQFTGALTVDGSKAPAPGPNGGRAANVNKSVRIDKLQIRSGTLHLKGETVQVGTPVTQPSGGQ